MERYRSKFRWLLCGVIRKHLLSLRIAKERARAKFYTSAPFELIPGMKAESLMKIGVKKAPAILFEAGDNIKYKILGNVSDVKNGAENER